MNVPFYEIDALHMTMLNSAQSLRSKLQEFCDERKINVNVSNMSLTDLAKYVHVMRAIRSDE